MMTEMFEKVLQDVSHHGAASAESCTAAAVYCPTKQELYDRLHSAMEPCRLGGSPPIAASHRIALPFTAVQLPVAPS